MLHTTDEFHVSLPCVLRRTIWQLETPVVAPAPGANMPLSPSSVANAERMEKLSRTIRDSVSFLFERIVIIFLVVDGWLIFCFMFFFFCGDLIVKCSHWHYVLRSFLPAIVSEDVRGVFFGCRSYSAPKMTGEQRREARWDSRHHILFAKDRFCWLSGMNKGYVV